MTEAEKLDNYIREHDTDVYIAVDGCPFRLQFFIETYNSTHEIPIDENTEGLYMMNSKTESSRLYMRLFLHCKPEFLPVASNELFGSEYPYRINASDTISQLINMGYCVGYNKIK